MSLYRELSLHAAEHAQLLGELFDYLCDKVPRSEERDAMIRKIGELENFQEEYIDKRLGKKKPDQGRPIGRCVWCAKQGTELFEKDGKFGYCAYCRDNLGGGGIYKV